MRFKKSYFLGENQNLGYGGQRKSYGYSNKGLKYGAKKEGAINPSNNQPQTTPQQPKAN